MILIGQFDSPFVRRVAITLHHYELPFEHRPWSVWGDAEKIAAYNPLRRVPTLLLDDGSALCETFAIVDTLDELVGAERALLPARGPVRRAGLRVVALASGVADKAISLLYSSLDLIAPSATWTARYRSQVLDALSLLESERVALATPYWLGESLSHADVALACAFRFTQEALPGLIEPNRLRGLAELAARCEARAEFQRVYLPITNNLKKA